MHKADNLPPSCTVVTKSGNFNFLEPSGPVQARNGTALPLPFYLSIGLRVSFVVPRSSSCSVENLSAPGFVFVVYVVMLSISWSELRRAIGRLWTVNWKGCERKRSWRSVTQSCPNGRLRSTSP